MADIWASRKLSPINETPAAGTANTCEYMPHLSTGRNTETTEKDPRRTVAIRPCVPGQRSARGTDRPMSMRLYTRAGGRVRSVHVLYGIYYLTRYSRCYRRKREIIVRPTGLAWRVAGLMCAHTDTASAVSFSPCNVFGRGNLSFSFVPPFCGAGRPGPLCVCVCVFYGGDMYWKIRIRTGRTVDSFASEREVSSYFLMVLL